MKRLKLVHTVFFSSVGDMRMWLVPSFHHKEHPAMPGTHMLLLCSISKKMSTAALSKSGLEEKLQWQREKLHKHTPDSFNSEYRRRPPCWKHCRQILIVRASALSRPQRSPASAFQWTTCDCQRRTCMDQPSTKACSSSSHRRPACKAAQSGSWPAHSVLT
jgi:hypothetical protein